MSTLSRVPGFVSRVPRVFRVVIALIASLTVVGGTIAVRESHAMENAFNELMKRPSVTAVDADYQSMFSTIRERLTADVGVGAWAPDLDPVSGSFCDGDLTKLDGSGMRFYNAGTSHGNLPDAKWDRAVTIVTAVARQHGFTAPEVIIDGPGDHEVEFHNSYGGKLLFGTGANTILTGTSGCHLTEEAHQRGTYLPPQRY